MKLGEVELQHADGRVFATIYYDTDLQATVDIWYGEFGNIENLKTGLLHVLDNIRAFHSKKWLADISKIEGNFDAAKEFIATEVMPQAMEYGLTCEALVLPHNIFSLLSVQETGLQMINHFELRMFATVELAIEWLNSRGTVA